MAKVPFTKLKCKINEEVKQVKLNDEITIEVKQYLSIQEKLALISRVVEYAHMQDANYSNPVKAAVLRDLEVVFAYTNIAFTEKQKEDIPKLYDTLYSSGIITKIIDNIPEGEYLEIVRGVKDSIESVYNYMNSIVGMLDTITKSQNNAVMDMETLQMGLANLQNSEVLKGMLPLLGLE